MEATGYELRDSITDRDRPSMCSQESRRLAFADLTELWCTNLRAVRALGKSLFYERTPFELAEGLR
jgi:hypothetical protein